MRSALRLCVVLFFFCSLPTGRAQRFGGDDEVVPCFTEDDPPSCTLPDPTTVGSLDPDFIYSTCEKAQSWYDDYVWEHDLFFTFFIFDLSTHAPAFVGLQGQDCLDLLAVYPHCMFCIPNYREDSCKLWTCERPDEIDDTVDIEATCNELKDYLYFSREIYTKEFCLRAEQAIHRCPEYSWNCEAPLCVSADKPFSCAEEGSGIDYAFLESVDVQDECRQTWNWLEFKLGENAYDLDNHNSQFDTIAPTYSCDLTRQTYPFCFWCELETDPDFCQFKMDTCMNPPSVEPDTDINATCHELKELFDRIDLFTDTNMRPASSALCRKAEQVIPYCPYWCPPKPCFWATDPCDLPETEVNITLLDALDLEKECSILEMKASLLEKHHKIIWQALSSIPAESYECEVARQVYPSCYWCSTERADGFCRFEDCTKPLVLDLSVNIQATCAELEDLQRRGIPKPATSDLCYRAEQAIHACPDSVPCGSFVIKQCFDEDHPPSCDKREEDRDIVDNLNLEYECQRLLEQKGSMMERQNDANALASLLGTAEDCEVSRAAYPYCRWCLDNTTESFCQFDTCDKAAVVDPSVDIKATCQELTGFFYFNQSFRPLSIDLCARAEQAIHACPMFCERKPCFTEDDPPSCDIAEKDSSSQIVTQVDMESECLLLHAAVIQSPYNLSSHLALIQSRANYIANTYECDKTRQVYPFCYFCKDFPRIGNHDCRYPTCQPPDVVDNTVDVNATCRELDRLALIAELGFVPFPATIDLCYRSNQVRYDCPTICNVTSVVYLGADTKGKQAALVWLSRTSAILSFLGASLILFDVVSKAANRKTVYHRLLAAMAIFDAITAGAWSFATTPLPPEDFYYVFGARGSETSCQIQAFFVQLGYTSVFYNASLALYYVLVIDRRWQEGDLKKIWWGLHGCPLMLGFALAFGILPVYDRFEYGCHLAPPDNFEWKNMWKVLFFSVCPIGCSILFITCSMIYLYWRVRGKARASSQWRMSQGSRRKKVENQVFWQALLYTGSFYVTWPIVFAVYVGNVDKETNSYIFAALVSFLAPLQGFNNFLVYARTHAAVEALSARVRITVTSFSRSMSFALGRSSHPFEPNTTIQSGHGSARARPEVRDPSIEIMGLNENETGNESKEAVIPLESIDVNQMTTEL